MENKLQQLTEKLYNEGLSKGRQDADDLVSKAKKESQQIVADANSVAAGIIADAQKQADELRANTENEIRLASSQMISSLRQQIGKMIISEVITPQVSGAWKDGSFVKELIVEAVKAWNPASEDNSLQVILPQGKEQELDWQVKEAVGAKIAAGVDIVTDSRVKVPFRIAPGTGGYYISFTDADFDALFKAYIRPKVSKLLFGDSND